jgi:sporulation protein YlmC with PRC-barrel domain
MFDPKRMTLHPAPRISAIAAAVALSGACLLAAPVTAQTQAGSQAGGMGQQQQTGAMQGEASGGDKPLTKRLPERYKLSTWMGKEVQNKDGEKLGTVKELVMDDLGIVRYVVMQSDLLADSKRGDMVAVPVGHFVYPLAREDHLVFDTTPGQVKGAPAFGAADTPNMGRQEVSSVIIAYWLPEAAKQRAGQQGQQGQQQAGQQGQQGQQAQQGQQQAGMQAGRQGQQQAGMTDYDIDQYEPNRDIVNLSQRKNAVFEELDKNDNDVISRQEARGHEQLSQRFDEVDTYGNQAITRSEFAAFEIEEDEGGMGQQGQAGKQQPGGMRKGIGQ